MSIYKTCIRGCGRIFFMKNIFLFALLISVNLFAQEIKFQAEKMDIKDGGDTILAFFSNTLIPSKKINIKSNKANYNKKTEVIIFTFVSLIVLYSIKLQGFIIIVLFSITGIYF